MRQQVKEGGQAHMNKQLQLMEDPHGFQLMDSMEFGGFLGTLDGLLDLPQELEAFSGEFFLAVTVGTMTVHNQQQLGIIIMDQHL